MIKLLSKITFKLLGFSIFWLVSGCSPSLLVDTSIIPGGINSNSMEEYPVYSSDSRYLAFASDRNGQRDIFLYDFRANRLVDLPNLNRNNSSQDRPSLSADGRYIAYMSTERGKTDVLVYDRHRQKSELLTAHIRGSVANPTINGDGTKVAFQNSQLGKWKITIVNRNIQQ